MLTNEEKTRYARQIILPEIGKKGQEKLKASKVLIIGAGGLGSPSAMYLACAGVGTIGILDDDIISISNLQRQILHSSNRIGMKKVDSARQTIVGLNPNVSVETHDIKLSGESAENVIGMYDLVVDAVDNLETRYIVNDTCQELKKPLIEGGVMHFDGMILTVLPGKGPCFRCIFPQPPPKKDPREIGVLAAIPGIIGCMEAVEAIKVLLDIGDPLVGRLLLLDGLEMIWHEVKVSRDPNCISCSR
ncbi:MAG: HesA/MoeB/ThiF family protein [Firmicutes bacterium]|nr:HesA/MoeB/ThiF family protein [Bacillota bacterium]